ncbi:MAG TPA: hypothetical protein VHH09_08285 [Acidimicrobiales bacterium]|nr:hypothetical protein [Acidimicrobiales bacterium]
MAEKSTVARSLHELGLAGWFGGSLMGAIGVNGAAAEVDQKEQRARVANAGWNRWTPVNLAFIGAHLVGSTLLAAGNKGRISGQRGVAATSAAKTLVTGAALAATAYARTLGQKVIAAGDVPVEGGTTPAGETPSDVADAQRKLNKLQWAIPALTGSLVLFDAYMGEQQRPAQVASGVLGRILPN